MSSTNTFVEVLFDAYPNTSGGQIQAQAKANQLQGAGYRVSFSVATKEILWQNHLPGGQADLASSGQGILLLTAVTP